MKKILLMLFLAAIALSGCRKVIDNGKPGEVSFSVTPEGEFTPVTKAVNPDETDVQTFKVTIKNASGELFDTWERFADVPSVIPMDPASYTISASSPNTEPAAFNQPIYQGSQNFTVEAGKVVNINIICKLTNMKVSVKCTQNFLEELNPDFTIKVSTQYGFLEFTKADIDEGTSKAGYFTVAPITVFIKGTRNDSKNTVINHYFNITNVAAQDHHVITVDANETGEVQVGASGISVVYQVNNKPIDIMVGELEENPVEDDNSGIPVFQNSTIADGATDVDTLVGGISLTYSYPVKIADNANITLGSVPVTTSCSGKVLTVSFGQLAALTQYSLNIPAGAVLNASDNSEAAAKTISFTTVDRPKEVPIYITATGGIDSPATYTEGQYGVTFNIDIQADETISSFPVEVKSEGLKGLIYGLDNGCDETVDLAAMSAAEEEFWGGMFGTSSAGIKGGKTVQFAIGGFISMMPVGTHPIQMTVIDAKGNKKTSTITFVINAKSSPSIRVE